MNTNNRLAFMQAMATFSFLSCLGLAYTINPIDESLFFKATNSFVSSIYGEDVLSELNNSVVAGMLLGLFIGTVYVFLVMNKKAYNSTSSGLFVIVSFIFFASIKFTRDNLTDLSS